MAQAHAHFAFAHEQFDLVLVVGPFPAQHLDGDDAAAARIIGAEDPAEAPRGDFVEDAITAEEVPFDRTLASDKMGMASRVSGRVVGPFPDLSAAAILAKKLKSKLARRR
jgi:hypothetical protein